MFSFLFFVKALFTNFQKKDLKDGLFEIGCIPAARTHGLEEQSEKMRVLIRIGSCCLQGSLSSLLQIEIRQPASKSYSTQQVNLPRGFLFAQLQPLLFEAACRILEQSVLFQFCEQAQTLLFARKQSYDGREDMFITQASISRNKLASLLLPIVLSLSSRDIFITPFCLCCLVCLFC